jgi:hypothetical protein
LEAICLILSPLSMCDLVCTWFSIVVYYSCGLDCWSACCLADVVDEQM